MDGATLHQALVMAAGGVVVAAISGLVAWLIAARQVKSQDVTASAVVQEAINSGFNTMSARYGELLEAADERDKQRVAENEQLTKEVRDLKGQIDTLTGYVRELLQIQQGLVDRMRKAGMDIPDVKTYGPGHPLAESVLGAVLPWPKEG